jgi:hypothetical protein
MADLAGAFRQALREGDAVRCRQLWGAVYPDMPQPSPAQAEIAMHRARTETNTLPLKARRFSHAWLIERGYPSGLPDRLKPPPEQIVPRIVRGVGVSVNFSGAGKADLAAALQEAMSMAAGEAMVDGADDETVSAQMWAARYRIERTA